MATLPAFTHRFFTAGSGALVRLLKAVFYPVACICIRRGMSEQQVEEILRWCFVQASLNEKEFAKQGREVHRQTISHVAVQTGLTRMEALKYSKQPEPEIEIIAQNTDRASRILSAWYSDPRYHDSKGNPADLRMRGTGATFQSLAMQWGRDAPPRSIADVLVGGGCAEWLDGKRKQLRFVSVDYPRRAPSNEEWEVLAGIAADFGRAMQAYLKPETRLRPQFGSAGFADISRVRAPELRDQLNEILAEFSQSCEVLLDAYRAGEGEETVRAGVGSYTFFGAQYCERNFPDSDVNAPRLLFNNHVVEPALSDE